MAVVRWTAPTTGATPDRYEVERNRAAAGFTQIATATNTLHVDAAAQHGDQYRIRAVSDVYGAGAYSGTATYTAPSTYLNQAFYSSFPNAGMLADPNVFPLSCWYQDYDYAVDAAWGIGSDYATAMSWFGLNLLYNLDPGHTVSSTTANAFNSAGIKVILDNPAHRTWFLANSPSTVVGYLWGEEWDMNYPRENFYPSVAATKASQYRAADASRPLVVNWGKPMSGWGIGYVPEPGFTYDQDMTRYQDTTDGTCSDRYGWTDPWEGIKGAFLYGDAVDNQRKYAGQDVPVWQFVEASRPWGSGQNGTTSANLVTPAQMESAMWNALLSGASGICWFLQDMWDGNWSGPIGRKDLFESQGLKMKELNARVAGMAQVLNTKPLGTYDSSTGRFNPASLVTVSSSNSTPIKTMVKQHGGQWWLFAQANGSDSLPGSGSCTGTFTWQAGGSGTWTVDGEARTKTMSGGVFTDTFTAYQTHIYRLAV